MQLRNQFSDPFDQLVADTLREQMGPAPSPELWENVRRQITTDPAALTPSSPPVPEATSWLQRLVQMGFQTPLARGALTVALFGFILLAQPELEALWHPVAPSVVLEEAPGAERNSAPAAIVRDVAFERLIQEDGKWNAGFAPPSSGLTLRPVANPAELHGQVRPDQPVLLSTVGARPTTVQPVPRLALSGGTRQ